MRIAPGKFGIRIFMAVGLALAVTTAGQVQTAEAKHKYARKAAALIIGGIALHHVLRHNDRHYYGHHRRHRVLHHGHGHRCFKHRHGGHRHKHCRRHHHHHGHGIGLFFGHY